MALELAGLETLIPFLFIFAITYGALEVSGYFQNKAVKAIIALCISFFSIMNSEVTGFINQILPYAAIFFVIVFFIGFITKPFRKKAGQQGQGGGRDPVLILIIVGLAMLILAQLASPSSPLYNYTQGTILGNESIVWIAGLVMVLALFYYAFFKIKAQ
jgi:hypothetical protein